MSFPPRVWSPEWHCRYFSLKVNSRLPDLLDSVISSRSTLILNFSRSITNDQYSVGGTAPTHILSSRATKIMMSRLQLRVGNANKIVTKTCYFNKKHQLPFISNLKCHHFFSPVDLFLSKYKLINTLVNGFEWTELGSRGGARKGSHPRLSRFRIPDQFSPFLHINHVVRALVHRATFQRTMRRLALTPDQHNHQPDDVFHRSSLKLTPNKTKSWSLAVMNMASFTRPP